MVLLASEVVGILMRWAHITSVVVLVGGILFARFVAAPVFTKTAEDERLQFFGWLAARYRPLVYSAIAGLIVSGLYNLLTYKGHTGYYHMWFGIKMLLALHVFAASALAVKASPATAADEAKRSRRMTGIVASGLLIILISAYLRRIY